MTEVQMDLVQRKVTFGAVPMAALRASHLETWVKVMVSDGYAPNTVATRVNAVRAALKSRCGIGSSPLTPPQGSGFLRDDALSTPWRSRRPTRSER
jgi:hypothetical protein